jgi:hypothetical protein
MTARTLGLTLVHLRAIFFSPFNDSYSSFETDYVMGTEKRCFFPSGVVMVFIWRTSKSYISFMKPVKGVAQP